jgi:dihydrofolate reductase
MRKIIVTMFMTLDGVMEAPDKWSFPYWNDEIAKFKGDEMYACDTLLLGRVTYEGFATAWPSRTDKESGGARMNSIPKFVVSTTLKEATWNNSHLIQSDIMEKVRQLKAQPGKDILVYGSGQLVETLAKANLVDQYQLLVYPLILGEGKRLFEKDNQAKLKLVESKSFSTGVVLLVYQPA